MEFTFLVLASCSLKSLQNAKNNSELCTPGFHCSKRCCHGSCYFPSSTEVLIRLHHLALGVITAANPVTAASLFAGLSPEPGGGAVHVINAHGSEWIINKQNQTPLLRLTGAGGSCLPPSAWGGISAAFPLCCRQGDEMTQRDGQLVYLCACLCCD